MALLAPGDLFPEAYNAAKKGLEKIDLSNPNQTAIEKGDHGQLILLLTKAMSDFLHIQTVTQMTNITQGGDHNSLGGAFTAIQAREQLVTAHNTAVLALANIQTVCHQTNKRFQDDFCDTSQSPINTLPIFTDSDNVAHCTDSSLKHIQPFEGNSGDAPESLQNFLRQIFDVQKTATLNQPAVIRVIQRKCTSVSRTLLDEFLQTLDITADDALLKVVLHLESKYALSWSPRLAKQQLQSLQKTFKDSNNYTALQASILKLSSLAALGESAEDRATYLKSSQLPTFMNCVSKVDQSILLKAEATRAAQNQPPLTLSTAVQELLTFHASRQAHKGDLVYQNKEDSMIPTPAESEQVLFSGQERRSRVMFRGRPAADRNMPFRPQSRGPPDSRQQNRQRDHREPRDQSRRRYPSTRKQDNMDPTDNFIPWQEAKTNPGACIRCNSAKHLMTSKGCPFYNTPVPKNQCRACPNGGYHYSKYHSNLKQESTSQDRPQSSSRGRGSRRSSGYRSQRSRGSRSSAARRLHSDPAHFAEEDNSPEEEFFPDQPFD